MAILVFGVRKLWFSCLNQTYIESHGIIGDYHPNWRTCSSLLVNSYQPETCSTNGAWVRKNVAQSQWSQFSVSPSPVVRYSVHTIYVFRCSRLYNINMNNNRSTSSGSVHHGSRRKEEGRLSNENGTASLNLILAVYSEGKHSISAWCNCIVCSVFMSANETTVLIHKNKLNPL